MLDDVDGHREYPLEALEFVIDVKQQHIDWDDVATRLGTTLDPNLRGVTVASLFGEALWRLWELSDAGQ